MYIHTCMYVCIYVYIRTCVYMHIKYICGSDDKESACNAGDLGLTPGIRKILWSRKWQPTPVILPGESTDRGAWWATILRVTKSRTGLSD